MTDILPMTGRLKATHTPGPWRVKYGSRHDPEICDITISGDIFLLADINGPNYSHCEANARLIAAAPEMLAALKAQQELETTRYPTRAQAARVAELRQAAIAKAEGRSND